MSNCCSCGKHNISQKMIKIVHCSLQPYCLKWKLTFCFFIYYSTNHYSTFLPLCTSVCCCISNTIIYKSHTWTRNPERDLFGLNQMTNFVTSIIFTFIKICSCCLAWNKTIHDKMIRTVHCSWQSYYCDVSCYSFYY